MKIMLAMDDGNAFLKDVYERARCSSEPHWDICRLLMETAATEFGLLAPTVLAEFGYCGPKDIFSAVRELVAGGGIKATGPIEPDAFKGYSLEAAGMEAEEKFRERLQRFRARETLQYRLMKTFEG